MLQQVRCLARSPVRSLVFSRQANLRLSVATAASSHRTGGVHAPIIQTDDPRFSFSSFSEEIKRSAAPGTFLKDVDTALAVLAQSAPLRPESCQWMVIKCGVWLDGAEEPTGPPGTPARAVFCITPSELSRPFKIFPFHLDGRGLPTNQLHMNKWGIPTATIFEKKTSGVTAKKYNQSCWIQLDGRDYCRLSVFITAQYGEHSIHRTSSPSARSVELRDGAAGAASTRTRRGSAADTSAAGKAQPDAALAPGAASARRRTRQPYRSNSVSLRPGAADSLPQSGQQ